jgi:hypothetical protein
VVFSSRSARRIAGNRPQFDEVGLPEDPVLSRGSQSFSGPGSNGIQTSRRKTRHGNVSASVKAAWSYPADGAWVILLRLVDPAHVFALRKETWPRYAAL